MRSTTKTRWDLFVIIFCSVASNLAAELLADEVKLGVKTLAQFVGLMTP